MYTWQDATLKELEGLVKEVNPEARRRGTYFDFALVYPDLRQGPRCQTRDIGTTIASQRVSKGEWFVLKKHNIFSLGTG